MRNAIAATGAGLVVLALALPPGLNAVPSNLSAFTAHYPSVAGTKLDSCLTCHTSASGGPLNLYGIAVAGIGFNFAVIEERDSDGDGVTNGDEINSGTYPGDATDTPGGGASDGRVLAYIDIADATDATSAALAVDTSRDEAFAVWIDQDVDAGAPAGRLAAAVWSQLVGDQGEPAGTAVQLDGGDVDPAASLSVAYGNKRFLAAWDNGLGGIDGRVAKARSGKALKMPTTLVAAGAAAAVGWDGDLNRFLLASEAEEVSVEQVTTGGEVGAREPVEGLDGVLAFAAAEAPDGVVLLGSAGETNWSPATALLQDGKAAGVSENLGKATRKTLQAVADFGDEGGLAAWTNGTTVFVVPLAVDGSPVGKASRIKGATAGRVAVALQADGNFLVVWTGAKRGRLVAVDVTPAGQAGESFELQADGEDVDPDVLAAAAVGEIVVVVYAARDDLERVRAAAVATQ